LAGSVRRFVLRDGIVTVSRSFLRNERQRLGSNAGYAAETIRWRSEPRIW